MWQATATWHSPVLREYWAVLVLEHLLNSAVATNTKKDGPYLPRAWYESAFPPGAPIGKFMLQSFKLGICNYGFGLIP